MIKNLSDLAAEIGCKPESIGKALYKGTKCGIVFYEDAKGFGCLVMQKGLMPIALRLY